MTVIYKYRLPFDGNGVTTTMLPEGARLAHVDTQGSGIFLWAEVDPKAEPILRQFLMVATGEEFDGTNLNFVGTVLMAGGALVWHIFVEKVTES